MRIAFVSIVTVMGMVALIGAIYKQETAVGFLLITALCIGADHFGDVLNRHPLL